MHPTKEESKIIYTMWKEAFAFDDGGSIDDYFKRNFCLEHCYIKKEKEQIVACLCAHPHTMILHNKDVPVLFISGVITRKQDRYKGYMRQLIQEVFALHPLCPLWILQAYHPEIYTSLGFQNHYKKYTYKVTHAKHASHSITKDISSASLLPIGNTVLSHFDGYFKRDENWWENYVLEAQALSLSLCGLKEKDTLVAYMNYTIEDGIPHITELLYQKETQKDTLIASLLQDYPYVLVDCFLPLKEELYATSYELMVRLGNKEELKNILHKDVEDVQDVFTNTNPLYHYGYW